MIDEYIDKLIDELESALEEITSLERDIGCIKDNEPLIKLMGIRCKVGYVYSQLSIHKSYLRYIAHKNGIQPKRRTDDNSETETDK